MFTGNQEEERIDDERREDVFIRKLRIRRVQWNGPDCNLQEFSGHPFKVVKDAAMYELMESIRLEGVLVPLLLRPVGQGGKYEIIAGHRRKMAAEWAGLTQVPAIVRNLDDDQAVIAMIDSNLQRERILPSEKAYAYKMRLEAMKHQGKRIPVELTSAQVDP